MANTSESRLILIRPGTTDFDRQRRIVGTLDIPMNHQGRAEIQGIADQLAEAGVQVIYHSPCQAAEESAQMLSQVLQVKPKTNEYLRNLDHGLWQGKLIDEVRNNHRKFYRQWQEHPETVCPPEGEMLALVQQRVETLVQRLRRKHKSGVVAVVAPEPYASILKAYLLQEEVGDLWRPESQCPCEVLTLSPPQPLAVAGND